MLSQTARLPLQNHLASGSTSNEKQNKNTQSIPLQFFNLFSECVQFVIWEKCLQPTAVLDFIIAVPLRVCALFVLSRQVQTHRRAPDNPRLNSRSNMTIEKVGGQRLLWIVSGHRGWVKSHEQAQMSAACLKKCHRESAQAAGKMSWHCNIWDKIKCVCGSGSWDWCDSLTGRFSSSCARHEKDIPQVGTMFVISRTEQKPICLMSPNSCCKPRARRHLVKYKVTSEKPEVIIHYRGLGRTLLPRWRRWHNLKVSCDFLTAWYVSAICWFINDLRGIV